MQMTRKKPKNCDAAHNNDQERSTDVAFSKADDDFGGF